MRPTGRAKGKRLARDTRLAAKIVRRRPRTAGFALRMIWEARAHGLEVSELLGLIEGESDFRHVFGHDAGGPFPGQRVTKGRVLSLVRHVRNGGTSNGVDLGQLTWLGYIEEANRDGGAWVPRVNIATAANIIGNHKHRHGWMRGLSAYNTGNPDSAQGANYARRINGFKRQWHNYLT